MTKDKIKKIHEFYKKSGSFEQTALEFKVSASYIQTLFRRAGLKTGRENQKYSEEKINEMHEAYKAGSTFTEISKDFDISISYLFQLFKKRKFVSRSRGRPKGFHAPEVLDRAIESVRLYKEGFSLEDIGKKFNVTRERVRQYMDMLNEGRRQIRKEQAAQELQEVGPKIKELADQGYARNAIADKLGVSYRIVSLYFNIHGIRPKRAADHYPIKEWERLYKSGKSTIWISTHYKVNASLVSRHLNEAGIQLRDKYEINRLSDEKIKQISKLRKSGLTLDAIAHRVGASVVTVNKYLNRS